MIRVTSNFATIKAIKSLSKSQRRLSKSLNIPKSEDSIGLGMAEESSKRKTYRKKNHMKSMVGTMMMSAIGSIGGSTGR